LDLKQPYNRLFFNDLREFSMTKNNSKIKPLGDRILIKILESTSEKRTSSGIIIPETIKEDSGSKRGEVVAVGEGRTESGKLIKPKVSVGDTVLFSWGDDLVIDGEKFYLVSEQNVLAIIK